MGTTCHDIYMEKIQKLFFSHYTVILIFIFLTLILAGIAYLSLRIGGAYERSLSIGETEIREIEKPKN